MHSVVILGAKGLLGTELMSVCGRAGFSVAGLDLPEVDITRYETLPAAIPGGVEWIVNCAGYTQVDKAENDRKTAFAVNADGARHAARLCSALKIRLVHLSTDYVFDGTAGRPYKEDDKPNPLNAYGESKLAGEIAVRAEKCRSIIVRTESLFGLNGNSFVRAILKRLREGNGPLKVINDQVSSPTYVPHLADGILNVMNAGRDGTVHVTASGSCTWFDFANAIAKHSGLHGEILPVSAVSYGAPARRPAFSALDMTRYKEWTGKVMPSWTDGLAEYLETLKKNTTQFNK